MGESPSQIEHYLDMVFAYGPFWAYIIISFACFVENLFPPFPGDMFIVAGGALVALGRLDLSLTLGVVVVGGMSSVMILYGVGRKYGRDYLARKNYRYLSLDDLDRLEKKLARWGALLLLGSRFVAGFRAALAVAAGIGRYPMAKMIVYSLISYLLFSGLLMYVAGKLSSKLAVIEGFFRTYNLILWPILVLGVVIYFVRKRLAMRK